ncbi:MAG: hypothetical protein H6969_06685 [Gammaproteobacteria bacterium]|nr:hypothetical protein [Gammaproteobacteria bacterium]
MPLRTADLNASAIWRTARRQGQLVFAMNQTLTEPVETPGPWGVVSNRTGYCLGLSIQWLALLKRHQNFDFDQQTGICNCPPWQATMFQNIHASAPRARGRTFSGAMVQQHIRDPIRAATMLIRYTSVRLPVTVTNFHQILTGFPNTLWLIVLDMGPGGGAHAVAAQHDAQGHVHFFDPNYGHFFFADFVRFRTWFQTFLIESNYAREYVGVQFFCVI